MINTDEKRHIGTNYTFLKDITVEKRENLARDFQKFQKTEDSPEKLLFAFSLFDEFLRYSGIVDKRNLLELHNYLKNEFCILRGKFRFLEDIAHTKIEKERLEGGETSIISNELKQIRKNIKKVYAKIKSLELLVEYF
jgi:hypothetical protein